MALRSNCPSAKLLLLPPFWHRSARAIVASLPIVRRMSRIMGVRFVLTLPSGWQAPPGSVVLHCPLDEMVPIAHSRQLLAKSGLPPENLVAVAYNGHAPFHRRAFDAHRMSFASALPARILGAAIDNGRWGRVRWIMRFGRGPDSRTVPEKRRNDGGFARHAN